MAHSRSALKRWRQSEKRHARNRSAKSATRTMLTRAISAINSDVNTAETAVRDAVAALDRAAQKGVIHANAASRGKSRLLKRYNLAQAGAVAAAASAPQRSAPSAPAEEKAPPAARRRGLLGRKAEETPGEAPKRRPRTPKTPETPEGEKKTPRGRKTT